jgi:hypothetical protein
MRENKDSELQKALEAGLYKQSRSRWLTVLAHSWICISAICIVTIEWTRFVSFSKNMGRRPCLTFPAAILKSEDQRCTVSPKFPLFHSAPLLYDAFLLNIFVNAAEA